MVNNVHIFDLLINQNDNLMYRVFVNMPEFLAHGGNMQEGRELFIFDKGNNHYHQIGEFGGHLDQGMAIVKQSMRTFQFDSTHIFIKCQATPTYE